MAERELDLVLLGATGFVGRLTASHLARSAPPGARIALAGRSAERLADLRRELATRYPVAGDWGLRTTDVTSRPALDRLAEQTAGAGHDRRALRALGAPGRRGLRGAGD